MPETNSHFDWPVVLETSTHALVGSRVFEPFIEERRSRNATSWNRKRNWWLGFYFGRDDTRLWVPRKLRNGMAVDESRVINFGHHRGKTAFRILMTGYAIGLVAVVMTVAAILGVRW